MVRGLEPGAAVIQFRLQAVAQAPGGGQEREAFRLDLLLRLRDLALGPAGLRQDQGDLALGALAGEAAGEGEGRAQIVLRRAGRQKDDRAFLRDIFRQIVGEGRACRRR